MLVFAECFVKTYLTQSDPQNRRKVSQDQLDGNPQCLHTGSA